MIEAFDLLEKAFVELDIKYDSSTLIKFEAYMKLVLDWNQKVNLTTIVEETDFVVKHFIDSIMCAQLPEMKTAKSIIDVGTGAGFPGIPLAILYPQKDFMLMDSVNKKLLVLKDIIEKLDIRNVRLIHGRAEDLAHNREHREKYDICLSRAVARLAVLSELCLPFVKKEGYFIAYKGKDIDQEVKDSIKAIDVLGGRIELISPFKGGGVESDHQIIYIKKIDYTPEKYPRKPGLLQKEPI